MSHTKEPWSNLEWAVCGPTAAAAMVIEQDLQRSEFRVPTTRVCQTKFTGQSVVALALGDTQEQADANAARIVACVNACEHIPNESLTPGSVAVVFRAAQAQNAEMLTVIAQRDELLQALDQLADVASGCDSWESFPSGPLDRAYSVIERIEKERTK